jgi:hypothetical protein
MNTIDLAGAVNALLAIACAVLTAAVPIVVPALLRSLKISADADLVNKVDMACTSAAGEAYRFAVAHEGGLSNVAVQNGALAVAANYVLRAIPQTLDQLGITPDKVEAMVAARLGTLLASDPTVSAMGGTIAPEPPLHELAPAADPGLPATPTPVPVAIVGAAPAALALLVGMGVLLSACGITTPPAPPSLDAALYETETGFDIAMKQAIMYATLPLCAPMVPQPCSDIILVRQISAKSGVVNDDIRTARAALVVYHASGGTSDLAKAQTAVTAAQTLLTSFGAIIPSATVGSK